MEEFWPVAALHWTLVIATLMLIVGCLKGKQNQETPSSSTVSSQRKKKSPPRLKIILPPELPPPPGHHRPIHSSKPRPVRENFRPEPFDDDRKHKPKKKTPDKHDSPPATSETSTAPVIEIPKEVPMMKIPEIRLRSPDKKTAEDPDVGIPHSLSLHITRGSLLPIPKTIRSFIAKARKADSVAMSMNVVLIPFLVRLKDFGEGVIPFISPSEYQRRLELFGRSKDIINEIISKVYLNEELFEYYADVQLQRRYAHTSSLTPEEKEDCRSKEATLFVLLCPTDLEVERFPMTRKAYNEHLRSYKEQFPRCKRQFVIEDAPNNATSAITQNYKWSKMGKYSVFEKSATTRTSDPSQSKLTAADRTITGNITFTLPTPKQTAPNYDSMPRTPVNVTNRKLAVAASPTNSAPSKPSRENIPNRRDSDLADKPGTEKEIGSKKKKKNKDLHKEKDQKDKDRKDKDHKDKDHKDKDNKDKDHKDKGHKDKGHKDKGHKDKDHKDKDHIEDDDD